MSADGHRTAFRTCPLCEATCGLEIKLDGERIVSIRGDEQDVFSRGFICPKGSALRSLHEDPDRVRTPLIRDGGSLREATWDEAFALIDARLSPILGADRNSVALYLGNPNAHNLSNLLYLKVFARALGSQNVYSASTLDQFPKQMSSALMFGTGTSVPIPDVDRTQHLLMLGANPLASNGSLMTAPDMRGPAAGAARPRRQIGGDRSAAHPHGPRGRRTSLHPPGHRRPAAVLARPRAVRRGPVRSRSAPGRADARASMRCASWPRRSRRRPWPRCAGSRPTRSAAWLASWPPPPLRRCTGGSAPAPRSSARWPAGCSTCSTC